MVDDDGAEPAMAVKMGWNWNFGLKNGNVIGESIYHMRLACVLSVTCVFLIGEVN